MSPLNTLNTLDPPRIPATYAPRWYSPEEAAKIFTVLSDDTVSGIKWVKHPDAPRREAYFNDYPDPYTYGRGRGVRTYHPQTTWTPELSEIRGRLEQEMGVKFEALFLNQYLHNREHLGWHADDSPEMDPDRPICVVSFGAERAIQFRPKVDATSAGTASLRLKSGSLLVMEAGMQKTWEHRIPKSGTNVGARISLTFRGYLRLTPP